MKKLLILVFVFSSMTFSAAVAPKSLEISGNWQFRKVGDAQWLPATVPGCVHTDLLDLKLIQDPFYRKNEQKVKWVDVADWEYRTTFDVSDQLATYSNIALNFGGLDTYADVYLNDALLFKADNMFIAWEIPIKKLVKKGKNNLRIYFHSAVNTGLAKLNKIPYTLMAANEIAPESERSNVVTRKAPFHYGWDWGPRLVTCGVWKPVTIQAWNNEIMNDLYVKPINISAEKANYKALVEIAADKESKVKLEVWVDHKLSQTSKANLVKGENTLAVDFAIEKPELWWTNGLGGQKLYSVEVKMMDGEKVIQSISKRIGVRTLELVQDKDSIGTSFTFKLNGVKVFMKGSNYIPSDIFTTRNTLPNYQRAVEDALGANMNMLRIWGGAIYENDELYDLLDENGILAWNDFMFACSVQPDDSLHLENIKKEAEYNVKRLRNHTSIALWCGNNENLRAWNDWGWKKKYTPTDSAALWKVYEKLFYQILPNAVQKYQPEVSYWASSPQAAGNKLSDRISGDEHDWTVWFGDVPFSAFAEKIPRFVSEFGLQAFPEMKTIKAFANDSDMSYRSPIMEHRQRSAMPWMGENFNGNEMMKTYISRYYKVPEKFEDFVFLSQVMQAEGVKFAVETHRGNMPRCMGTMYWQINDCWPTMSWASVDYFGRWKALHYFVKKSYQAVYPIIVRDKEQILVKVANDKLLSEKLTLVATLYDFVGNKKWSKQVEMASVPNSSKVYLAIPEKELLEKGAANQTVLVVEVKAGNELIADNMFYFKDVKELLLEKPVVTKSIKQLSAQEFEITLSTDKLAKNVALFTSKIEGKFSDNYFDILPGKNYSIKFSGNSENLSDELELKCVNGL
jgi:beta-mannosidase